jgi:hypothetical protein
MTVITRVLSYKIENVSVAPLEKWKTNIIFYFTVINLRESYSNTLTVAAEVSFQLRTPRDDAQGTVICRPPRVQSKKESRCPLQQNNILLNIASITQGSNTAAHTLLVSILF